MDLYEDEPWNIPGSYAWNITHAPPVVGSEIGHLVPHSRPMPPVSYYSGSSGYRQGASVRATVAALVLVALVFWLLNVLIGL